MADATPAVSPLRRRMIDDMTLRNLSPATQRSYFHAVSKFSRYFDRSPDRLGLEDVRAFQVYLVSKGISWPALNQTVCALRFFYGGTLNRAEIPERSLGYNLGLKTIRFDDMNWEEGYGPNSAYSQSKLAQMMFAYELQDRLAAAGRTDVEVYVCHPGSSATSLISTGGSRTMRAIWWLMTKTPMVQTAEQGAYPEVMGATEEGPTEQRALYGPTDRIEAIGPVGRGTLNAHAYDKAVMEKLWEVSENATGFVWRL